MSYSKRKLPSTKSTSRKTSNPPTLPFTSSTNIPYYDQMLANPSYFRENKGESCQIIMMSPQVYEDAIQLGFDKRAGHKTAPVRIRVGEELASEYAERMKAGDKFPMPILDYEWRRDHFAFSQEGHHRAVAARKAGISKIPVFVKYPTDPTDLSKVIHYIPFVLPEESN